jgi:MFS family permease
VGVDGRVRGLRDLLFCADRPRTFPIQRAALPEVISQGFLGYALTSVMGPIVAEIFEGPHYGSIFGTITVALIGGGAAGPWITGIIHDATGSYRLAFLLVIACCIISVAAIWIAAPRNVRLVAGRISSE